MNVKVCDGFVHCQQASDEIYCSDKEFKSEKLNQFCSVMNFQLYCEKGLNKNMSFTGKLSNKIKKIFFNGNIFFNEILKSKSLTFLKIQNHHFLSDLEDNILNFPNLVSLSITRSILEKFYFLTYRKKNILKFLNISHNSFKNIGVNLFDRINVSYLITLDISYSNIQRLTNIMFKNLNKLKILYAINNKIKFIEQNIFQNSIKIEEIYLNKTKIPIEFSLNFFQNLKNLKKIISDQFQICCILKKISKRIIHCSPQPSIFLTCDNIIPNKIIRILLWIFWIVGFFGNILTIFMILKIKKQTTKLFRLCLSFSDLITIFYLFFICLADLILEGKEYLIFEEKWRYGIYCKLLGSFTSTSLLFSMFNIMGITFERFLAIVFPLNRNFIENHNKSYLLITFAISVFLGFFPLFIFQVKIIFLFKNFI